jgi:hypothetical protein
LRVEEFILEGFQGIIVQMELYFEGPIGQPPPLTQEHDHLIHHRNKIHPRLLPAWCSASIFVRHSIIA